MRGPSSVFEPGRRGPRRPVLRLINTANQLEERAAIAGVSVPASRAAAATRRKTTAASRSNADPPCRSSFHSIGFRPSRGVRPGARSPGARR